MNMISFAQFDSLSQFSGDNSEQNEKEAPNGEFSALLSSFCVPLPIALPAASPVLNASSAADSPVEQFVAPLNGKSSFTPTNLPTADNFFAKISSDEAIRPKEIQPAKNTGENSLAADKFFTDKFFADKLSPDKFSSADNPAEKLSGEKLSGENISLPQPKKALETDGGRTTDKNDAPANSIAEVEFLVQTKNAKGNLSNAASLLKTPFINYLPAQKPWELPTETKSKLQLSIGTAKGLPKIFQAITEAPIEKGAPLNFLNQSSEQTKNSRVPKNEIDESEKFSLEDLTDEKTSAQIWQNSRLEKSSVKLPDAAGAKDPGAVVQTSEAISELSSKITELREPQMIKLRLRPAELGTVEIKLEQTAAGKINAHLTTHLESTRQILTENISDLHNSLEQAGWRIEQLEISCDSSSNSTANLGGGNQSQPQQTPTEQERATAQNSASQSEIKTSQSAETTIEPLSNRLLSVRA